ncbi:MAG: hypothetical protein ACLP0J_10020 [Solirubrobacteraceae bacterium]
MPDFIDRLGAELTRAASAEPQSSRRARWRPRWLRSMPPRPLLVVPALAVLGTGAALTAGILLTGTPVGPQVAPTPTAGYEAANPATTTLLPLHVADPAGGLPWGLRTVRTTRDDVCLQVGRLADGTIGALGEDGSFGNDQRFHPFSDNYQDPEGCVPLDADGHGFTNAVIWGLPTSAMAGGGCLADFSRRRLIRCPTHDTRDVYFGLLGPDAASITYVSAGRQTVSEPTVGSDGAYLIVTPARRGEEQGDGSGFTALLKTGPIQAVTYHDGHTCRPTTVSACALVGFVAPNAPHLTPAALASPIHVREIPARSSTPPQRLFKITYTARVAVTSTASFYYISLFFPPNPNSSGCHQIATGSPTTADIRAGQQLVDTEPVLASCHGIIRGLVRYHPASAIHSGAPEPDPTDPGDITVGRFSLRFP